MVDPEISRDMVSEGVAVLTITEVSDRVVYFFKAVTVGVSDHSIRAKSVTGVQ